MKKSTPENDGTETQYSEQQEPDSSTMEVGLSLESIESADKALGAYSGLYTQIVKYDAWDLLKKYSCASSDELHERISTGVFTQTETAIIQQELFEITNLDRVREKASYYYPDVFPAPNYNRETNFIGELTLVGYEFGAFRQICQATPNGDIYSAGDSSRLYRRFQQKTGKYDYEIIGNHKFGYISNIQVLPNGDVYTAGRDGIIYRWYKIPTGGYDCEEIGVHVDDTSENYITVMRVLPNGEIYSAATDGIIYHWYKDDEGVIRHETLDNGRQCNVRDMFITTKGIIYTCDQNNEIRRWNKKAEPINNHNGGSVYESRPILRGEDGKNIEKIQILMPGKDILYVTNTSNYKSSITQLDQMHGRTILQQDFRRPIDQKSGVHAQINGDIFYADDKGGIFRIWSETQSLNDCAAQQIAKISEHTDIYTLKLLPNNKILISTHGGSIYLLS